MKTRHIIAIGLLSALAVGILGLAIHTGKAKAKTLQTNAIYNITECDIPAGTNTTEQINFTIYGEQGIMLQEANMEIGYIYELQYRKDGNTLTNYFVQTIDIDYIETPTDSYVPDHSTPIHFQISGEISIEKYTIETHTIEVANGTFYNEVNIVTYYYINSEPTYHQETFQFQEITNENDFENRYDYTIDEIATGETIATIYNTILDYSDGTYENGYQTGYTQGVTDGTTTGYETGYNAGYGIGYNDSEAFNHPIALQPLMLNILTMPFTFISQAFDVTLWPGTQYEFNIANFIKGMIAIATIMFIIKLFTSGFSILGNYTGNHYQNKLTRQKIKESKSRTALNNRTDPNNKTIKKG